MSSSSPLHRLATQHFDERYKRKQSESFLRQPQHTIWASRHRKFENPIFIFGCFSLKAVYNSCKLQSFCLCTPLLLHFSGTYLVKLLFFINVCYQMKCFSGDSFSLFWDQILLIFHLKFLISCEVQTRYSKTLKYPQQYIWNHLLGTKVRIWICFEYDAVFSSSCIASFNLTKLFTFSFISVSSKESDSQSFKQ